ncbi:MDR family MFS transporter [Bacillus sp. CGMCC 1.16607]|uniref:MDR family MFS transporter n=1 Tax=Bacillus sp. CGMCC 1.16607 TaxID=3351842 RepID=UPI00362C4FD6
MKSTKVRVVLTALFIGVFMENLDHTIMATAIPSVVAEIGGMDVFSWVFSVYLLTSTIFIPVFGKLSDQYGKKPFLLIGFMTFVVASALSANAESMWQLITYRAIQGLGAAPLMPIAFSMIFELVKPEKQGKMQALFALINGLSLILGPLVGAYLTDNLSWHWVFWINVPLGAIAAVLIALFYKEQKLRKKVSIDYAGATSLTLAIAPLMIGLVTGGKEFPWTSWQTITLFSLSVLFTYIFIQIEKKAKEPIIALHLFNKKVVSSSAVGLIQGFVMIAVMVYIPFFIQGVLGGSATHVGKIVVHMIIAMIVGTGIGGHLLAKISPRALMFSSILLMTLGSLLLIQIDAQTTDMFFFIAMILIGLGMGPLFPVTTLLAQTSVNHEHTTSVTSIVSFFRNIGMALGSSLLAVIVNSQVSKSVLKIVEIEDLNKEQVELLKDPNLLVDPTIQALVPHQVFQTLQNALSEGIVQVFIATIGMIILMFVFSFLAGKERLVPSHHGKKIGFH